MKRIAIVYHFFPAYRQPIIQELFDQTKSSFQIAMLSDDNLGNLAIKRMDESFLREHHWTRLHNHTVFKHFTWQSGLLTHLAGHRYDAVIFLGQMNMLVTWIAVPLLRMRGTKTIAWTHGVYGNEGAIKMFIRLGFYRLFNRVMLYGNYARSIMLRHGFRPENLYVIWNSLDYRAQMINRKNDEQERALRSELAKRLFPSGEHLPIAVFIGRLTFEKHLDLLLSASAKLNEDGIGVNVLFIGKGPAEKLLREKVGELKLEQRVCFYGECYDEATLSSLISISHVCVSPGNVGLTAMHALTYGTPVVTHDCFQHQGPEFEAVEDGVNGSFFHYEDLDDLCRCIRVWICKSEKEPPRHSPCMHEGDRREIQSHKRSGHHTGRAQECWC